MSAQTTYQPKAPETCPRAEERKYLESRHHAWRQQPYVKGHRLLASDVWNYLTGSEGHPVEDAMENWELPREAVDGCLLYCESYAELLASESEEERRR